MRRPGGVARRCRKHGTTGTSVPATNSANPGPERTHLAGAAARAFGEQDEDQPILAQPLAQERQVGAPQVCLRQTGSALIAKAAKADAATPKKRLARRERVGPRGPPARATPRSAISASRWLRGWRSSRTVRPPADSRARSRAGGGTPRDSRARARRQRRVDRQAAEAGLAVTAAQPSPGREAEIARRAELPFHVSRR